MLLVWLDAPTADTGRPPTEMRSVFVRDAFGT